MISTEFSYGYSSRSYNLKNLQQASILIWRNKNQKSAIMPILLMSPKLQQSYYKQQQQFIQQRNLKCLTNSTQNSYHKENQQIYLQWSYIAKLILQQGPLLDFQLLISNYQNFDQKLKFRVNINDKEKLIISAYGNQNVGEVCDKILISFFNTCVIQGENQKGTLTINDLPTQINKIKINNRVLQMKEQISRVGRENDLILVSIGKKNIIDTNIQKKLLRKYEEYNQIKAKEIKYNTKEKCQMPQQVKNSNSESQSKNNNKSNINTISEDSLIESNQLGKKKVKVSQNQQRTTKVLCKILLCLNSVYVDIWDPVEEESMQLQLSQEESVEDLKWLLENYLDYEQDKIQLNCTVYASHQIFEFENKNLYYELFNEQTSTLTFYHRLKGG